MTTTARQTKPLLLGTICHSCAVVLVNDDDSHLTPEAAEEVRATLAAIRRDEGVSLTTDPVSPDGYFRCIACGDDCLDSTAYRLHGWRD